MRQYTRRGSDGRPYQIHAMSRHGRTTRRRYGHKGRRKEAFRALKGETYVEGTEVGTEGTETALGHETRAMG